MDAVTWFRRAWGRCANCSDFGKGCLCSSCWRVLVLTAIVTEALRRVFS